MGKQLTTESARDRQKARELRRVKAVATALLVFTAGLFVVARHYEPQHWAWGYVAAFAAAATVGGLADWYAIVALFRRPLGLPIPHTAIVPRNHHRIADTLGEFIETNFLARGPVHQRQPRGACVIPRAKNCARHRSGGGRGGGGGRAPEESAPGNRRQQSATAPA